jgi:16S rRNA (guanine527-N7)-methyltransferase
LSLPKVHIHRGRAEEGITVRADVVVVRAVAALDAIVRMSSRLLVPGGMVLALKGEGAASEVDEATRGTSLSAELLSLPAPGRPATVVRLTGKGLGSPERVAERPRGQR